MLSADRLQNRIARVIRSENAVSLLFTAVGGVERRVELRDSVSKSLHSSNVSRHYLIFKDQLNEMLANR